MFNSGALWNSRSSPITSSNPMKTTTRNMIRQIKTKLKSNLTGQAEFSDESAVIDYAVQYFFTHLKNQRRI